MKLSCYTFCLFFLFITISGFAKTKPDSDKKYNFDKKWAEISKLQKKGLPKQERVIAQDILLNAKAENNGPQVIKAILAIEQFNSNIEENSDSLNFELLKKEIKEASGSAEKAILMNLLAGKYKQYKDNNQYNLDDNQIIENGENDSDFHTWSASRFDKEIHYWAFLSLNNKDLLQKAPSSAFTLILDTSGGNEKLTPTIYDLLTRKTIGYFSYEQEESILNGRDSISIMSYKTFLAWQIEKEPWYKPNDGYLISLKLYQELEKFHLNDKEGDAFVDADISRMNLIIKYSDNYAKFKDEAAELKSLEDTYKDQPVSAIAGFERARMYNQKLAYNFSGEKGKMNQEALDLCNYYIGKYPKSFGAKNCEILKKSILAKTVTFSMDTYVLPGKALKITASYQNVDKVWYRIVALADDEISNENKKNMKAEKRLAKYVSMPALFKGSFDLPLPADYEQHKIDLALPELPFGSYIILCSRYAGFDQKAGTNYSVIQVTGMKTLLQKMRDGSNAKLYVLDADNGDPVADADVLIQMAGYGKTPNLSFTKKTNTSGYIDIDSFASDHYFVYSLTVIKGKDRLHMESLFKGNSRRVYDNDSFTIIKYYTDRAIYRPGQTVYFKGIVLKTKDNNRQTNVIPGFKTETELKDENDTKISSQTFTSNEFGSFSGRLVIPASVLNGEFTIEDNYGRAEFSVEEYKRPKFEIKFSPQYKTYRINDSIVVEGDALNYSGSSVDNSNVHYTITASSAQKPFQVKTGTIKTDAAGHFKFGFKSAPYKIAYYYNYRSIGNAYQFNIEATVSDITGETQSAEKFISLGNEAFSASMTVPEWINMKESLSLKPVVVNVNNEPVKVQGTIEIDKMADPQRPVWDTAKNSADQYLYDVNKYQSLFPYEVYKDESRVNKVEKIVFTKDVPSNEPFNFEANQLQLWRQGYYRVIFSTKDTFGNTIKTVKNFKVYDPGSDRAAINYPAYFILVKTTNLKPGQVARIIWGSAVKATAHVIAEHEGKIVYSGTLSTNMNQVALDLLIEPGYLGGLKVTVFSSVQNHAYTESFIITIPYPSKELEVKTKVFHSSLQPGQKETWTISIKGPNAKNVQAEMMATLYDASLDVYKTHAWEMQYQPYSYFISQIDALITNGVSNFATVYYENDYNSFLSSDYIQLMDDNGWNFGEGIRNRSVYIDWKFDGKSEKSTSMANRKVIRGGAYKELSIMLDANDADTSKLGTYTVTYDLDGSTHIISTVKDEMPPALKLANPITPRKNLQELAFFYPQLKTNDSGEVEINFTMPEALTRWNFMALAHTKDVMSGLLNKYAVTQKQLMVQPNAPRFLREEDEISFTTKVSNMSDQPQDAIVNLQLINPYTQKTVDNLLADDKTTAQKVHIDARQSKAVSWKLIVPKGLDGFIYRINAVTPKFSDGEEGMIPVLPKRILITESIPVFVRGNQVKEFKFNDLLKYKSAETLSPYSVSMEMTANPAWYAVQALPYLMEFPHECSEQVFNRFFANAIATYIIKKEPRIKEIFTAWQKTGSKTLQSPLENNAEVKNILLNETPWVKDAEDESARKKRMAELFNDSMMKKGMDDAITKLEQAQLPDGSWPWFPGMQGDRNITGYICSGIGRLETMLVFTDQTDRLRTMGAKAFLYLDKQMKKDYDELIKNKSKLDDDHLTSDIVTYLYARTYWKVQLDVPYEVPLYYWLTQGSKYYLNRPLMEQAMLVSAYKRQDEEPTALKLLNSIDDRALHSDEMGMYWKENVAGYGIHQQPIETQCMMIEAYSLLRKTNIEPIEEMKLWLLRQKQTHNWPTTTATAEAVYCLLLKWKNPLTADKLVSLTMGSETFDSKTGSQAEPGTGYFSHSWPASEINPTLGNIKVDKKDDGVAWGAVNFQYYQDMDKVKAFSGPIDIRKEIYVQQVTNNSSPQYTRYNPGSKTSIKTGDLVKIRIEIRLDRDMEYIHLKDLRAGAFEPADKLSGYKYEGGLGYYQEIKDASMNFFFDHISKGTYIFEYNLRATQTGEFQNGIATIENMYAPEFKSHTPAIIVKVGGQ